MVVCGRLTGAHTHTGHEKTKTNRGMARSGWQIRRTIRRRDAEQNKVAKCVSHVPRKAAIALYVPVPSKPTQVDEEENPKAGGRSIVKELGKMTP